MQLLLTQKMKYKIIHETTYEFSSGIFLEPHLLRFKPRNSPNQIVESFSLQIAPNPAGINEQFDPENNLAHFCWFEGEYEQLHIHAESTIHVKKHNPFNFILHPPEYWQLPFKYSGLNSNLLKPAFSPQKLPESLLDYGEKIKKESSSNTIEFLTNLTQGIHSEFSIENREEGEPFDPGDTFHSKKGSCRDLAWMQLLLLRSMGVAGRFVSGYAFIPDAGDNSELHAWIEVFLPGAGWIGLDPSHGIFTSELHFPIASSSHYLNTMTVTGSIRGDATSILSTKLFIEPV